MLINDRIIFDRYYCINSARTKEIMEHYILQTCQIFMRVKAFFFYARSKLSSVSRY